MRRFVVPAGVLALILSLPSAASAQSSGGLSSGAGIPFYEDAKPLTPEEAEKRKAADTAYRASLKRIPEQKKVADPWGDTRGAPQSDQAAQAKASLKPKPAVKKAGATHN